MGFYLLCYSNKRSTVIIFAYKTYIIFYFFENRNSRRLLTEI